MGKDWKPGAVVAAPPATKTADTSVVEEKIVTQGNKVRDMKAAKAPKVRFLIFYRVEFW